MAWLREHTPPPKPGDPTLTAREKQLARWSATEYVAARRAGSTTCQEHAAVLVKRMQYYKPGVHEPVHVCVILCPAASVCTAIDARS